MNVTLISLEALILKATHESLPCPDAAALEAFCAVMRDSVEGQQLAAQAFAARIHSLNPREALLALTMLDRCMRRCDAAFHAEIGKFRFLNEMIKLVSPKYFANRTAPDVKTRVLQLLHAWSIEYPKEAKFKVAYEMLKNQGVVKETPPPLPPEDVMSPPKNRAKSAIFENEEKSKLLQKLLQSKKPEDLQHANRLIKTMVKEEERRTEESSRRALEVGAALDSAGLLREMLARAADASPDEHQLIHELHASCLTLRPVLQTLAASEAQADNISDILHASDILDEVFEQYNVFVINEREKATPGVVKTETSNSDSLLDFATANVGRGDEKPVKPVPTKNVVIDELGDIFSTESASSNVAEPLKPVNLMQSGDLNLLGDKPNKKEGWNELDSLGDQLMKQSLPDNMQRIESFNSKSTRKVPMNALTSPKHKEQPINNGVLFDLDFFIKKPEDEIKTTAPPVASSPTDDAIVDISTDLPSTSINNVSNNSSNNPLENILGLCLHTDNLKGENNSSIENEMRDVNYVAEQVRKESCKKQHNDVKSLSDIHVTLDSVQPSQVAPMTVFEEDGGVSVVLHFCRDKPRPDVNVIVISTTSKNKSPIQDYKFQSVVPKGCKVRLLTASGASLPAYNPFLPPPALTQVMLIARPTPSRPIALKFVITYTCEDDMCSEMESKTDADADGVRCYCNTAQCVGTAYMCRSTRAGGCYSELPAPRRAHHARHGCLRHLADTTKEALSRCQNSPGSGGPPPSVEHSLLLCCFTDLCNHEDSPLARARLNLTSIEYEGQTVASERGASYNGEVWFKAATIAVPVCGALILFLLVAVAVRLLKADALLHADRKLRGGYMSPLAQNTSEDIKKVWVGSPSAPLLVAPGGCLVAVERAQLVDAQCQQLCDIQR